MSAIANLAGVAESTVSRALADSPLVSQETKDLIQKLAVQNGYVVNAFAANFRKQTTGALALVVPVDSKDLEAMTDPFNLEMIGAVAERARECGFDLLISLAGSSDLDLKRHLLSAGRVDGIIVIGQAGRHEQLNALAAEGAPMVVWGGRDPNEPRGQAYLTVGSDNLRGGDLATRHMIERGRRRIAFFGDVALPEVAQRYQGYCDAHQKAQMQVDKALCIRAPFSRSIAKAMLEKFLVANIEFDGICAASDLLAMTAISTLSKIGLSTPQDVSITGYDNVQMAQYSLPPLTTICQGIFQGGAMLVDTLCARLRGESCASAFTETRLIERATT